MGAFVVDVPLSTEDTWYVRLSDSVVWFSAMVLSVAILARVAKRVAESRQASHAA
jgi:apolipoprotein N-acyltransferase